MTYGYISDLPRFDNYHEASAYYDKTKGVRGRSFIKPLKTTRRSPDNYRIEKHPDGSIECWLYRTRVVIYYPDRIVINTYNSQTTVKFIDAVAPHWLSARIRDGRMRLMVAGEGEFVGDRVVIPVDANYKPIKGDVLAATVEQVVLNKTRAAEARKAVKDVVELARVTSKIDGYWHALKYAPNNPDDPVMLRLQTCLKIFGWRAYTFDGFKQHLYLAEYRGNDCYDFTRAPYGVIPKKWRTVCGT